MSASSIIRFYSTTSYHDVSRQYPKRKPYSLLLGLFTALVTTWIFMRTDDKVGHPLITKSKFVGYLSAAWGTSVGKPHSSLPPSSPFSLQPLNHPLGISFGWSSMAPGPYAISGLLLTALGCAWLGLVYRRTDDVAEEGQDTMSPWMGQSWNPVALTTLLKVIRHPSMAVPHLHVAHIGDVDFKALQTMDLKGVVFDKDNTLTAPYVDTVHPLAADGLARCLQSFPGRVCVLSNSAGTDDDIGYESACAVENALGIPVIRHHAKKPGGMDEVLQFFEKQCNTPVKAQDLCIIGDRLLTDIVFGNLHGAVTIHTGTLCTAGDNTMARIIRPIENFIILTILQRCVGLRPPAHPTLGAELPSRLIHHNER